EYRTELDSFSKIVASGTAGNGVASFSVQTKAGLTMEYGNTADSRIEAQGKATVRVWAINKISDVKTNFMTFSYTEDNANGDFYPSRIDYAGNTNAGIAPANSVQFTVETRPDVTSAYRAGSLVKSTVRLAGAITYAGGTPVMNYRVAYLGSGAAKSRVSSITECLPDGSCRSPISLNWKDGGTSYVYTSSLYYQSGNSSIYAEGNRIWFVDVNGDGLDDHVLRDSAGVINVALSNGSEFVYTPSFNYQSGSATLYGEANRFWFADVNGDGLADLVVRDSSGMINVALSTGSSFVAAPSFNFQSGASVATYAEANRIWFIDVNGDGRADHVIRDSAGVINVALSTGTGFVAAPSFTYQSGSAALYGEANRFWFADVNGDGLVDLVVRDSAGVINVAVSTGASFVAAPGFNYQSGASVPAYTEANRIWFVDINGDGLADHVMRDSAGVINVALSMGTSFVAAPGFNFQSGASVATYAEANRIWFVDVNGDGLPDHVIRDSAGTINVALSSGTSFVPTPSFSFGAGGTSSIYSEPNRMWFADVNGDGLPDHILRDSAGGTMVRLFSPARDVAGHLQSISNKIVTSLTYKPLTDKTVYTKDISPNAAAYPKLDLQYAQYVVSTVASSNGIGGTVTTQYNYGGLKAEQGTGRGMLGFRWMKSQNLANNIESYTEFNQTWPFTGSVAKSETRLAGSGNAGVLKRTTNS
ncbi:Insecticide toxin TcdB like protein, partial [Polaromonas sp. CF318]|uniref:FG-GAP-like repeat-containing protein n=1 Tax=Polaromonas sp. CF318 TaxID=1144318 RepID=UPI000271103F